MQKNKDEEKRSDYYFGKLSQNSMLNFSDVLQHLKNNHGDKYSDYLNQSKLEWLKRKGIIETEKQKNKIFVTDRGLEQLANWIDGQVVSNAKKSFWVSGIRNNPVWDNKKHKRVKGDPFTKSYVLNRYDVLVWQRNFYYDVTVDGDYENIKNILIQKFDSEKPDVVSEDDWNKNRDDWLLSHWKDEILTDVQSCFDGVTGKCFYIYHNKDKVMIYQVFENGKLAEIDADEFKKLALAGYDKFIVDTVDKPIHCHGIFVFDEPIEYRDVYAKLKISSEENLKPPYDLTDVSGAFQYLVHETDDARKDGKHNYDRSELNYVERKLVDDKVETVVEVPISSGIHWYELYYRKFSDRSEYIKDKVREGVWSDKTAYEVAEKYLKERDNNKLVESKSLELQNAQYLRNESLKYKAGERLMNRKNIAIVGGSSSGKTALATNWAKMRGLHESDFFESGSKQDGMADDMFGNYNGQSIGLFHEFESMNINTFKQVFDLDNIGNVSRKLVKSVPYLSQLNIFTAATEVDDLLANFLQYSKGGSVFQNTLVFGNGKGKRGFKGLSDDYETSSEYTQIGCRLIFLKINGSKIEVYQFVRIIDRNGNMILRRFKNQGGTSCVNYFLVGVVDGYNIKDFEGDSYDMYKKRVSIARATIEKIENLLDEKNAWRPFDVDESKNKPLFDKYLNDTEEAFESAVNETVENFYKSYYSRLKIAFVPWNLLYQLYKYVTFSEFVPGRLLGKAEFELEFRKLILADVSMVELSRSKYGSKILSMVYEPLFYEYLSGDVLKKFPYFSTVSISTAGSYKPDRADIPQKPSGVLKFSHLSGKYHEKIFKEIISKVIDERKNKYGAEFVEPAKVSKAQIESEDYWKEQREM